MPLVPAIRACLPVVGCQPILNDVLIRVISVIRGLEFISARGERGASNRESADRNAGNRIQGLT
jgi:hypothetical protein